MIVGRGAELASIESLLEAAADGRAGTLLLRGEAGIGKSSLLERAGRLGREQGFMTLTATGLESEAELAYSGLLELCRPTLDLIGELEPTQQDALRSALALGPATLTDRFSVAAATLGLLAEAADRAPVLILIDDAQWLDRASAEALWFAIRRLDADRVATLVTVRATHGDPLPGSLGELRFDELAINGIDLAATGLLLDQRTRRTPAAVVEALHTGTAGNPLALIELARTLTEGQLTGVERLADPLKSPARLHDVYVKQIVSLTGATRRALLVLAASGSDDHASYVRALASLGLGLEDLAPAEAGGLTVLDATSATFRHPLMRAAAYHAATPADRRAAHEALAAAAGPGSERSAWHRAEAALGPDEEIAAALEAVATNALTRGGSLAAGATFARAAALSPEPTARAGRLLRGADAFWAAGAAARANAMLVEASREPADPRVLGAVRHLQGHITLQSISLEEAHAMLVGEGLALADLDPAEAAFMIGEAGEAMVCLGEFERAVETARLGEPLAAGKGGMGEFFIAAVLGCGLIGTGRLEEGRNELRRSFEILEADPELRANPRAMGWRVMPPAWLDDYETALRMACEADAHARNHGALGDLVYTLFPKAGCEYVLGQWQQSYADSEESVVLALESGQHVMAMFAIHGLAEMHAVCGRDDECRAVVAEGNRIADGLGGLHEWPAFALGLLELGRGRASEAIAALAPAVRLSLGQAQQRAILAVFDLIEAYVLAGDRAAAETVVDAVANNYAGRPWELAGLARGLGMLATSGEYDAKFADSRARFDALGMRFESARTELCWGERQRRDGRRRDCREHLRAALDTFDALGARPWSERARSELRASGETIRRAADDRDELTARELQVVLQAVDGKTNREVGAALFLSPKTVDIHLTRAYRKLGIHSRTQLEHALARAGPQDRAVR